MAQMSIDFEAVSAAVNKVSTSLTTCDEAMKTFMGVLNEGVQKTNGNFSLLSTLEERLATEVNNVKNLQEQADEITALSRRYSEEAEQANDDSAFRE